MQVHKREQYKCSFLTIESLTPKALLDLVDLISKKFLTLNFFNIILVILITSIFPPTSTKHCSGISTLPHCLKY